MSSNRTTSPVCYPGEAAEGTRFPENANIAGGTGAYEPQRRKTLPNLSVAAETQPPAAVFSDQCGSAEVACFAHRLAQITAAPHAAVNRPPLLRRSHSLTLPNDIGVGASMGVGLVEPPANLDQGATAITTPTALARERASAIIQPQAAAESSLTATEQASPAPVANPAGDTPLHLAARSGDSAVVDALLHAHADVSVANPAGDTPLHLAARNGDSAVVYALLRAHADVNVANQAGDTPLHLAARNGDSAMVVDALLRAHADVDVANQAGDTPLHLAIRSGHSEMMVDTLLRTRANVNVANPAGDTPLHLAARNGDSAAVHALLHTYADVNVANPAGDTPLHLAACNGDSAVVYALLRAHAEVNIANPAGDTPLHLAARNGHLAAVQCLSRSYTDVNVANPAGDTPLHLAARNGHLEVVRYLSESYTGVNGANQAGDTPLHLAARNGHLAVVHCLLLPVGSPIRPAARNGHWALIQQLFLFPTDVNTDVNRANQTGDTPLHLAARNGHLAVVQTLLRFHTDINRANQAGDTPLQLAARSGYLTVVQALEPARAAAAETYNLEPIFSLAYWENFAFSGDDPARESFTNFLRQLGVHRLGNGGAPIAPRLEKILECIKQDPEANKDVLSHVIDFGSACQDSALYRLRGMEIECLLWELSSADKSQQSETIECHFIRALQTVHRHERLQTYISTYMEQNPGRNDEVEIRLYFEQQLHEALGFVGEKPNMHYLTIGQVPDDDVVQAKETLLQQERDNPDGLRDFMLQEQFWRTYLKKRFSDAFTAMLADFHAQQEQLEKQAGFLSQDPSLPAAMTTNAFNAKSNNLNVQREQAEKELLCKKTDEILERFTERWREEGAA